MWVHIHILNTVNQNNTKWRKPPECSSMDEWMDHVCLHTECHLAFTSKETLVLAVAYTNLKGMLSELEDLNSGNLAAFSPPVMVKTQLQGDTVI